MPPAAARSLADELRTWSDDDLAALLTLRPDLAVPLPPDLTTLAARVASRTSVQRALDGLDAPTLQVVEVLAALPEPTTPGEVTRHWGTTAGPVLDRLRALALLWGGPRALRLVRSARDLVGPTPAGLGPPVAEALGRRSPQRLQDLLADLDLPATADPDAALARLAEHLGTRSTLESLLAGAPTGTRELLERLTWGPPVGQVADADRPVRAGTATGAVEWLLAHGMLGVADASHVVLPREVALALRGGRVHRPADAARLAPPELDGVHRRDQLVRETAAGAAAEAVRLVEALGEAWGAAPPPILRAGGLGVRDLRRTAQVLETDERTAARVVELAHAAGLVADDGEADPRWAPTPAYDVWREQETGLRWAGLSAAWLATTRCPALVGTRDSRDAPRQALGGDLDRASAPVVRRWVLQALAGAPAPRGSALAATADSLVALLEWTAPRRAGQVRTALVAWTLEEAGWLGVTGLGAITGHGRLLLEGSDRRPPPSAAPARMDLTDLQVPVRAAAVALEAALPAPVDHVLLQADLTAVAPGPLEPALGRELALLADVESRGGATVYRFTPGSVRRALDAGRTGEEVLDLLTRHSSTPVPQPLRYLVDDTARRHGRVRVGAAHSYVRADDEAALAELLADRRAAPLRLRRLAPTVLSSQAPPETVLATLRDLGLAPAAETPDGEVLLRRPAQRRTPPRTRPRPVSPLPPTTEPAELLAAVRAVRSADEAAAVQARARQEPGAPPTMAPMDPVGVLTVLRDAATRGEAAWIGYVDASGAASRRLIEPLTVEAGRVHAFDRDAGQVRSFSVHRLTGVSRMVTGEAVTNSEAGPR